MPHSGLFIQILTQKLVKQGLRIALTMQLVFTLYIWMVWYLRWSTIRCSQAKLLISSMLFPAERAAWKENNLLVLQRNQYRQFLTVYIQVKYLSDEWKQKIIILGIKLFTFSQPGSSTSWLTQHCWAASTHHYSLCMGENRGDLVTTCKLTKF